MLRREERDFLDDVTLEDAREALQVPVFPTETDGFALWDAICGVLPEAATAEKVSGSSSDGFYRYN